MEEKLLTGRDIIMLGIQPWDYEIGCNFKDMAYEIARHNRVLYVNRPLDRITSVKKPNDSRTLTRKNSIKKGINVLTEIEKDLWVFNPQTLLESINWMPDGVVYKKLNKRNNKKLALEIKKAMEMLKFSDAILFIDNDFFNGLYLDEYLDLDCNVYYLRDFLLAQPYFAKHGKTSEPKIIAKVDLVVANSLYLTSYAKQYNDHCYYIGQGCGEEYFVPPPGEYPSDISAIRKPVIGYCGFLTVARLDIELLEKIARERPGWNLVLIGPEDETFKNSVLHNISNVHFLGRKDEKRLPQYVHYFDVCLNPQLVNQLTIGNYPRKVDEYLAVGKPVVATYTETMQAFADCTHLCKTHEEYIEVIDRILSAGENKEEVAKRVLVARSHSWENSIRQFYSAVWDYKKVKK